MCTTRHGGGTEVTDLPNNAQHKLIYVNITPFFFTCSVCLVILFCIKRRGAGQPFAVFQIILTVDNKAHEFVLARVFAAHLTDYLNSRSPVCSILNVYEKRVNRTNNEVGFFSHPANQSTFFMLLFLLPASQPIVGLYSLPFSGL
jgi:hypothetical protein